MPITNLPAQGFVTTDGFVVPCIAQRCLGCFFFAPVPSPLYTARMDRHPKQLTHLLHHGTACHSRFFSTQFFDKRHDLIGKLVRSVGTTFVGKQTGHPLSLESFLGVIKGGPRKAECIGGLFHRPPLNANPMQHLVLHLQQIAGIKKIMLLKQGIRDPLWVKIHRVAFL